ncbi:restriction endonuclease PLD domain-containing protein [Paenibacillus sp. Marseille-Q7038]
MAENTGRLRVRYYNSFPPLHANVILWRNSAGEYDLVFTGTANLTWNGFKNYREIMAKAELSSISHIFPDEDSLKDFRDHDIMSQIKMLYYRPESNSTVVDIGSLRNRLESCQRVELYLTQKKDGQVQEKSGLNWGQREGREPNQAYIPISSDVHKSMPDFFPDLSIEFMLITDDGEQFVCTVAQQNRKAIHTKDNSLLGKYFRKRLGIPLGEKVERKHLDQYGTDKLLIYKISDDAFYMDFTPNQAHKSKI